MYTGGMGAFKTEITVSKREGGDSLAFEAWVDTGAAYTQIPESALQELGIEPHRMLTVFYADGREDERPLGRAVVAVNGLAEEVLVIFGPDSAEPLLGAHSLQTLLLLVDSPSERLVPVTRARA